MGYMKRKGVRGMMKEKKGEREGIKKSEITISQSKYKNNPGLSSLGNRD